MTPLFSLQSIQKRYKEGLVLDLDQLEIYGGRCYRLTGHNGAGKSTLLNILALLSPPTSGTIQFAGEHVNWRSRSVLAFRQRVTLLHQSPYLFAGTVFANVAYGLKARKVPQDIQLQLVSETLAAVGLDNFQSRSAQSLVRRRSTTGGNGQGSGSEAFGAAA